MNLPPLPANASSNVIFARLLALGAAGKGGKFDAVWALRIRDHREKVLQVCAELAERLERTDVAKVRNPGGWANQTYQAICNGEARPA